MLFLPALALNYESAPVFPGGHGTFSNLVNNFVHIVMYSYYMVSAMGPQYTKYIWWKKYITTTQLVSTACGRSV